MWLAMNLDRLIHITLIRTSPRAIKHPFAVLRWTSHSQLSIFLNPDTLIAPGSEIAVRAAAVHPLTAPGPFGGVVALDGCTSAVGEWMCAEGSTPALPPPTPHVPQSSIGASRILGPCDALVLSGVASTGGGVYPLVYQWSLINTSITLSSAQLSGINLALSVNTQVVNVPAEAIALGATLWIALTVRRIWPRVTVHLSACSCLAVLWLRVSVCVATAFASHIKTWSDD